MVHIADCYGTGEGPQDAVTPILNTRLEGRDLVDVGNPDHSSAGGIALYTPIQCPTPAALLFESKNEIGAGDAAAGTHQVGLLYRKYWIQKVTPTVSRNRHPLTGSQGYYLRNLLPHIPTGSNGITVMCGWCSVHRLVYHSASDPVLVVGPQYKTVARLFAALPTGINELGDLYSHLHFTLVFEAQFFPHAIFFTERDTGHEVQFSHQMYVGPNHHGDKAAFIASTQDGRETAAKPTEAHNEEAHSPLTSIWVQRFHNGRHRPCRREAVVLQVPPRNSPGYSRRGLKALETLQENKFVFGDPRSPNTLATDQYHVQLMRFDLRGTQKKGRSLKISIL